MNQEEFEDSLLQQVNYELDDAEDYLDANVRPRITENWKYYNKELPVKRAGEAGYVDNTCQATVDHYVAHCVDAFTSNDTLEVIPYGVTNPTTIKVINRILNTILDSENNRYSLYQSFFTDTFISGTSIFKPYVKEDVVIDRSYFSDATEDELDITQLELDTSGKYTEVEKVITKEVTIEVSTNTPATIIGSMVPVDVATTAVVTKYDGYFVLHSKHRTIKVDLIPAENFLINRDAKSIDDARFVGHKSMTTISDLLSMGFDEDKVAEVSESCGSNDDANTNEATIERKSKLIGNTVGSVSMDDSQREVELCELYIKSSAYAGTDSDKLHIAKLYHVFYAENTILSYEEEDKVPYSGASPVPVPYVFWGQGVVDRTKHIQTAKSGLMRQQFSYNELVTRPRFQFVPEQIVNPRDIYNTQAGAGIAVKNLNAIAPLQLAQLSGDSAGLSNVLDSQREVGTGMTFTGQGMLGDVLKAGGSSISAQMVLTEGQMVQKTVITNLLENAIKPLLCSIYDLLKNNFSKWEVTIDNQVIVVNPNDWPKLNEVRINTPLGKTAKLEKANTYMSLYNTLATAQGEAAKLVNPVAMREVLVAAYEAQDINDIGSYLNDANTINQNNSMQQQLVQMNTMIQQLQQQLNTVTQQNQVLTNTASIMAQKELEIKEREVNMNEQELTSKLTLSAQEQLRKTQETEGKLNSLADSQLIKEKELELKYS